MEGFSGVHVLTKQRFGTGWAEAEPIYRLFDHEAFLPDDRRFH
jgi:hypothetical protein